MIKKNDTSYLVVLGIQALGISINVIQILFDKLNGIVFTIISCILCIIIPGLLILLEKRGINFIEIMHLIAAKSYLIFRK